MNYTNLKGIFELGRLITEDSKNPYLHLAYKYKKTNYRVITSGELFVRGKGLYIPDFITAFMSYNNEALMIANIIEEKVISILFRSLGPNKEFAKLGTTKATFYGFGDLDDNFRFGTPILLVEGHLDRDVMKEIYPNTLGIMTNHLSKVQVEILKNLTNKFILMLDNDDAGRDGIRTTKYQLQGCKISELQHDSYLKDAGDLMKLDIENHRKFEEVVDNYKLQIALY